MSQELTLFDLLEQGQAEEWRTVKDFPLYQVSDLGGVRRFYAGNWRYPSRWKPLKPWANVKDRYLYVTLSKNNRRYVRKVHRLVLDAFVGPRPRGMECRHLDGDRTNNRSGNLCWGTCLENAQDRIAHGTVRRGAAVNFAKLTEDQVKEIKRLVASGRKQAEVGAMFGIRQNAVSRICSGKRWGHLK